ncbi:hypothetical protein J7E91_19020 [Streptomyces sp. ISL-99]|uniref:hypothetical protein n=1 Tax=Streptomyces sp. ISL-99 TaxID=2819193 RepID=UPI001BEA44DA|nr:hypothetical protein [Streptomyces sp. ISL-99]MBT2527459.1 hypothetical protein [Streptomyces sp. ISL-99]
MLLLNDRFSSVAAVTDELSASLAEGRHADSQSLLGKLEEPGRFSRLILAWADLLSLPWPSSYVVFQQVRQKAPQTLWLPYAEAVVDGMASSDTEQAWRACRDALQHLDGTSIFAMLSVMAQGVRQALRAAGGVERLLECARLHHACAGPQLSDPAHASLISQAAWVIAANSAGHYEDARERTATLIGSKVDAMEMVIALWLQVAAQAMIHADGVLVEIDATSGVPLAVVEPGSDYPNMALVEVIQTAVGALQQQDPARLQRVTGEIAALADRDKVILVQQLTRILGLRVSQLLT